MKKGINVFAVVAAAIFLLGAIGIYYIMTREIAVEYGGKRFVLDAKTVKAPTFTYAAEDGDTVTGALCTACGGVVVTHGDETGVCGQAWKDGFAYHEQDVADGCAHGEGMSREDAYRFTLAASRKTTLNDYSTTVWLYWALEGAVLFFVVWLTMKKGSRGWVQVLLKVAGVVFAAAIYLDLLFM